MDNKVIEVFEYLGEKLGIAIDWTSENVIPQITEFMSRYAKYAIIKNSINIILGALLVIASCIIIKIIVKAYKEDNEDSLFIESHNWGIAVSFMGRFAIAFSVIGFLVGVGMIVSNVFTLIEWTILPEMKFIETFSQYIK